MNNLFRKVQVALCISVYILFFMPTVEVTAQENPSVVASEIIEISKKLFEKEKLQTGFDTLFYALKVVDDGNDKTSQLAVLDQLTNRLAMNDLNNKMYTVELKLELLDRAILLAKELERPDILKEKYYEKGFNARQSAQLESALTFFNLSSTLAREQKDHKRLLEIYYQRYNAFRDIGQLDSALSVLIDYEKYAYDLEDSFHIQNSTETFGNFYFNTGAYDKSIAYYKKGVDLANKFNMDNHFSLHALADNYDYADSVEQAKKTYRIAFDQLKNNKTLSKGEYHYRNAGLSISMGVFYASRLEKNDSSLLFFEEALNSAKQINSKSYMAYVYENMATLYSLLGDNKRSLEMRLEHLPLLQETGDLRLLEKAERNISKDYKALNDFKNAYEHAELSRYYNDSLLNQSKLQAIVELETGYETQKKDQEIALLNAQNERQRARQTGLIIIGILLLSIVIVGFVALRAKQKANQFITHQKEVLFDTNQKLTELSEFKDNLTHMIAHDMKNPLNAVIGMSTGDATSRKMGAINQSGNQMLSMVNNMLDVQKLEETKFTLHLAPHRLDSLLTEAKSHLELLMHAKNLTLKKSFSHSLCVDVDGELVVRILGNLLSNAIKFSELGGEIEVSQRTETKDGFVTIEVIDHGRGIPEDQLKQVFEKYWQGAKQTRYNSSTGLGLTFCKLAVEAHGGEISVDSKPGEFTHFSFSLPFVKAEDLHEAEIAELSEREESLILESDVAILTKYTNQLDQLKVHEVGKINGIIREIDEEDIKSPWKFHLISAIHQGDQNRFDQLVEMLK